MPDTSAVLMMAAVSHPLSSRAPLGTIGSLCDSQLLHEAQTSHTSLESKSATTLTLHVVNQSTQRNVLLLAPWTMIDPSLMCRTSKVLVQAR